MRKHIIYFTFILLVSPQAVICQNKLSPGNMREDWQIEGRIRGVLDYNNYFPSSDVEVRVSDGAVILSGEVPSETDRKFAAKVAEKLAAGSVVQNKISINQGLVSRSRSDIEQFIADQALVAKIETLLSASKHTHGQAIEVDVKAGIAHLKGKVSSQLAREKAVKIASKVYGLREVMDNLELSDDRTATGSSADEAPLERNVFTDAWISSMARSIMAYAYAFSGNDLIVTTKKGIVELKGKISNQDLRVEIHELVRDIPGVTGVQANITVR